jgi:CTP:molybdopterin cytidylyltransferase MocA
MVRLIVLAAGASSRMGQPKPTLPLDGRGDTFLTRIVRRALDAGLPEVVVVAWAYPAETRRCWPSRDRRVKVVDNKRWTDGQLSSLLTGLDAQSWVPVEAAAVTLVDVPLVSAATIARLVGAWRASRAPIVRPARGSEHGHPVIFDRAMFDALRTADPAFGAKPVVRACANEILEVPIDDPGAYLDVDTPQDYARLAP